MKLGVQEQDSRTSQSHEQQIQHSQIRVRHLEVTKEALDKVSDDLEAINQAISRPRGSVSFISEALKVLGRDKA